jgi:hypothetical protein
MTIQMVTNKCSKSHIFLQNVKYLDKLGMTLYGRTDNELFTIKMKLIYKGLKISYVRTNYIAD